MYDICTLLPLGTLLSPRPEISNLTAGMSLAAGTTYRDVVLQQARFDGQPIDQELFKVGEEFFRHTHYAHTRYTV